MPLDFSDLPDQKEELTPQTLDREVRRVSARYNVDPDLIHAVIQQESGGNPNAVSPQGAGGLMQLEPETAASVGVRDLFDWKQNLHGGVRYLRQGLDEYGNDPKLAAAYYHAGPDLRQWGPRTAQYSSEVYDAYRERARQRKPALSFDDLPAAKPAQQGLTFDDPPPVQGLPPPTSFQSPVDLGDRGLSKKQALNRALAEGATMAQTEAEAPLPPVEHAISPPDLSDVITSPEALAADIPQSQTPMPQTLGAIGRVGQAVAEGFGPELPGLSYDSLQWLRKAGFFPREGGGFQPMGQINEALLRPIVAGLDTLWRAGGAGFAGAQRAAYEAATAAGAPDNLARDIAAMPEAFMGMPHAMSMDRASARAAAEDTMARRAASAPTESLNQAAQGAPAPEALPTLTRMAQEATERGRAVPDEAAALQQRIQAAQGEGLKPLYNDKGEWVGYERTGEPATPEQRAMQEMEAAPGVAPETPPEPTVALTERVAQKPPAPSTASPFKAVPKEPERLASFVRRMGGMQDQGGDIASSLGGKKYRPGLINRNGLPDDEMALRAWESGYFPEFGDTRPSINDLRDALDDDLKGRPRYSSQDEAAAAAYTSALARNAELDRLAAAHDIPTTGITREAFLDQLGEKLSVEDLAREMEQQARAHEDAYAEFEKQAKDWAAQHPELAVEWNARDFYDQSQGRSLEDLERERQQETAATAAQQHEAGAAEPGPAGGVAGAGEEGVGPRGRGAGAAGRGETEAPTTDLLGRPIAEPRAAAAPEPTIRTDQRQIGLPGTEPSAVQTQAARDVGRGTLRGEGPQKPPDEGLFAPDTTGQGTLYSFPGMLFDPQLYRRMFGALGREAKEGPAYEVLRDKKGLAKAVAEMKAGFAPTSLRGAKPMEYAIRRHTAESTQAIDRSYANLEKVRGAVDKLSQEAQVEFTHRMETGERQPTPALQAVSDALRGELDGWAKKVQGLGRGYLANAVENYMGHIWGNYAEWAGRRAGELASQPEMEAIARAATERRAPLRGSGAFLKQRTFPTQLEGIEAGLVPVTFNPVELQLIKLREMQKFYHGTLLADRIKQEKLARWVPATAAAEADARLAGWQKLDDTIFKPRLMGQGNEAGFGRLEAGNYWAPEPLARIFNNYMSQGWNGRSSIYSAVRRTNNALNALQLGFSGFHAAFVTADTLMSRMALGLGQLMQGSHDVATGEFRKGAVGVARGIGNVIAGNVLATPYTVPRTIMRGAQLRRAWFDPENATPEMRQLIDMLKEGGGRVSMPKFFQTSASGAFFKSVADLKRPQSALYSAAQMVRDANSPVEKAVMVPVRIAARVLDTVQEPLMGALVPRAKLGVFADLASNWMRDHPEATAEEARAAMTKFMDSVDNRLGQLNYDNLFWNKTLKDLAFISMRSVGWNLGTVRELGGAFVDSAAAMRDIAKGKMPQFSTRMAYAIALPIVTAEIGAVMTYFATGHGPQQMLDYFYPPSGGQEGERRAIPGYMKDVIAFYHDTKENILPIQTVLNKTAPLWETIQEIVHNRDYYGGIIYDPERDRGIPQAYGDYLLNQVAPFSIRSYNRLDDQEAPLQDKMMAFWGFQPAPKSITEPERGEAFQARERAMGYRKRARESGRMEFLNAP